MDVREEANYLVGGRVDDDGAAVGVGAIDDEVAVVVGDGDLARLGDDALDRTMHDELVGGGEGLVQGGGDAEQGIREDIGLRARLEEETEGADLDGVDGAWWG